jgi:cytochrome bd-type quinol oxidase subunit 2
VPINSSGDFAGDFWDLFNAYTLVGGVAVVLLFAFHGATARRTSAA